MKSTHRSIIEEAETVYMSEGLSDMLYTGEESAVEMSIGEASVVTLHEEVGIRMISIVLSANDRDPVETLDLLGKKVTFSGLLRATKFKVTSVTYDRTANSITLLGSVLNT